MADRIEVDLDLSQAADSAKQLSAALQTTKTDATAFGAALESVDVNEVKLVAETTELQRALAKIADVQSQTKATTTAFSVALEKLAQEEAKAAAEAKRLADAEAQASAETARMTALFTPAAAGLEQVALAAQHENAALSTTVAHVGQASAGTRNLGMTMLTASYATQDFTSQLGTRGLGGAIGAIQNNIPMLLMGLGTGVGLTGVISVLTVGAGALYDNWDKIATLWSDGETLKEADRQKELAKSLEATREATQKLLDTPSKAALEPGGNVGKAIKEFGGPQVRKELEKAYREQFGNFDDATVKQGVEDIIGGAGKGDPQSRRLLDQMTDGSTINRQSDVMRRLRGEKTDAERRSALEDAQKADDAKNKKAAQDFKDRQAAKDKAIDDLNAQGREGEAAFRADAKKQNEPTAAQRAMRDRQGKNDDAAMRANILGGEFNRRSQAEGANFDPQQVAEAAKSVMGLMKQGLTKDQAMLATFQQIVQNQAALQMRIEAQDMRWQRIGDQARNVQARNNLLARGQ